MNVFDLRNRLVADYQSYTRSFIKIRDPRIDEFVSRALGLGAFWPEPLLQLNPTFQPGGTIDELVAKGTLDSECARIFRIDKSDTDHTGKQLLLHAHQRDAILKAHGGRSYVLTSGTGSGKSLAYIVPIVDHVLRHGSGRGIQAIVVYPMNALANSQDEELGKFLEKGYPEGRPPVRFARYTGQEKADAREAIRIKPPDILLTNYMMLELLLTRAEDRELVRAAQGLRFLVAKKQARDVLIEIARREDVISYSDLVARIEAITLDPGSYAMRTFLNEISTAEYNEGRGLLTAVVVYKRGSRRAAEMGVEGMPGRGFFELARSLKYDVREETEFWSGELRRVYQAWSRR